MLVIGGSWPSWWRRWPGRPPRPPRWHRTGCWPEDSPARSWHNTSVKYIHDHIWSNHCWVTTCPSPIWETGKWNGWFLKKWELNVWLPASHSFYVTLISDFRSHLFKIPQRQVISIFKNQDWLASINNTYPHYHYPPGARTQVNNRIWIFHILVTFSLLRCPCDWTIQIRNLSSTIVMSPI